VLDKIILGSFAVAILSAPVYARQCSPDPGPQVAPNCSGIQDRRATPDRGIAYCDDANNGYVLVEILCWTEGVPESFAWGSTVDAYYPGGQIVQYVVFCPPGAPHIVDLYITETAA